MMMGAREIRIHALKAAVQMKQRRSKDDDQVSAANLVAYAAEIEAFIKDGKKDDG